MLSLQDLPVKIVGDDVSEVVPQSVENTGSQGVELTSPTQLHTSSTEVIAAAEQHVQSNNDDAPNDSSGVSRLDEHQLVHFYYALITSDCILYTGKSSKETKK